MEDIITKVGIRSPVFDVGVMVCGQLPARRLASALGHHVCPAPSARRQEALSVERASALKLSMARLCVDISPCCPRQLPTRLRSNIYVVIFFVGLCCAMERFRLLDCLTVCPMSSKNAKSRSKPPEQQEQGGRNNLNHGTTFGTEYLQKTSGNYGERGGTNEGASAYLHTYQKKQRMHSEITVAPHCPSLSITVPCVWFLRSSSRLRLICLGFFPGISEQPPGPHTKSVPLLFPRIFAALLGEPWLQYHRCSRGRAAREILVRVLLGISGSNLAISKIGSMGVSRGREMC